MRVENLSEHRDAIPELAQLLYAEWQDLYVAAGLGLPDLIAALEARTLTDGIPLTLVAVHDNTVVGCGSLKLKEAGTRDGLSPWVGGLYVKAGHRGKGVGTLLLRALELKAGALGISALYLSADSAVEFYQRNGWRILENVKSFGVRNVSLMTKDLHTSPSLSVC